MDDFSFSPDDLEANRVGKLSQGQRTILEGKRRSGLTQVGAGVVVFVALLVVAYLALQPNNNGQGICVPFLLLIAALFGVLFLRLRQVSVIWDLRSGAVASVRGALILREELIPSGVRYAADIGITHLLLPDDVYAALRTFEQATPRRECVIYYAPASKTILSFEALEGAPPPRRPSFQEAVSRLYSERDSKS